MGRVGVIVETPALVAVEEGPIFSVFNYEVNYEINAAAPWLINFSATEELAERITTNWRITIVEEGPQYDNFFYENLLYRGYVVSSIYRVMPDGSAIISLQGMTRLYGLLSQSTYSGLAYDGTTHIRDIAEELLGEQPGVSSDYLTRKPKVSFTDTSKLAALMGSLEYARYSIIEHREGFYELVSWDDVPDSDYRLINILHAGPELLNTGYDDLIGLISEAPVIEYSGKELANRLISEAVDHDGNKLLLNHSDRVSPYTIQTGANPDGTSFYYIEDTASQADHGVVERHYVRSDVKAMSEAGREEAANMLYDLTVAKMQQIKTPMVFFGCQVANGVQMDIRPGYKIKVEYVGLSRVSGGQTIFKNIDQYFMLIKRRDSGSGSGPRKVAFELAAPQTPLINPVDGDATQIVPPRDAPDPPREEEDDGWPAPEEIPPGDGDLPPIDLPPGLPDTSDIPKFPDIPAASIPPGGAYQPCCADITTQAEEGTTPSPTNETGEFSGVEELHGAYGVGPPTGWENFVIVALLHEAWGQPPNIGGLSNMSSTLLESFTVPDFSGSGDDKDFAVYLLTPTGPNPTWNQILNSFGVCAGVGMRAWSSGPITVSSAVSSSDFDSGTVINPTSSVSASVTLAPTDAKSAAIIYKKPLRGNWSSSGPEGVFMNSASAGVSTMTSTGGLVGVPTVLGVRVTMVRVELV